MQQFRARHSENGRRNLAGNLGPSRFSRMKKGTMHVSVSGLRIPIFALSAFSLVCRAGLQGKLALCAQRGDANDHGLLVCSLAVAMMFHLGSSCTTRVSVSPVSFVPVAGPVDDQQRCSASSLASWHREIEGCPDGERMIVIALWVCCSSMTCISPDRLRGRKTRPGSFCE